MKSIFQCLHFFVTKQATTKKHAAMMSAEPAVGKFMMLDVRGQPVHTYKAGVTAHTAGVIFMVVCLCVQILPMYHVPDHNWNAC